MRVEVVVADRRLRRALEKWATSRGALVITRSGFHGPLHGAGVIVTTVEDCSLDQCRQLSSAGSALVVFASLPSVQTRIDYLSSGATSVLAMIVRGDTLLAALDAGDGSEVSPLGDGAT